MRACGYRDWRDAVPALGELRIFQVNKKEQCDTGVIGKLYRVQGMVYTGQCGEYGLGVRDVLRKGP